MTCDRFVWMLSVADAPSEELARHATECSACRALLELDRALHACAPVRVQPELPAALARGLGTASERRPVRFARLRTAGVAATAAGLVLVTWLFFRRSDVAGMPGWFVRPLVALALGWASSFALFAYRGRTGLGVPAWLRWLAAGASVVLFELWARRPLPLSTAEAQLHALLAPSHTCVPIALTIAAIVARLLFRQNQGTVLTAPGASGALLGTVAGLTAMLVLHVHCASTKPLHIALVHGIPLLVVIAVCTHLGRRFLRA